MLNATLMSDLCHLRPFPFTFILTRVCVCVCFATTSFGALSARARFGRSKVCWWRRSYTNRPPSGKGQCWIFTWFRDLRSLQMQITATPTPSNTAAPPACQFESMCACVCTCVSKSKRADVCLVGSRLCDVTKGRRRTASQPHVDDGWSQALRYGGLNGQAGGGKEQRQRR